MVQFQKLEKIEIGGNKGRTLSASVGQIYADFAAVLENFKKVGYDVLDVEVKQFDDDFYEFRCQIKELERRLGSVLNQASAAMGVAVAAVAVMVVIVMSGWARCFPPGEHSSSSSTSSSRSGSSNDSNRPGCARSQGFDDCATVFAAFKLIESFEGLLEREFIQADLERKHLELIKSYGADLRDVQDTFTKQKNLSAEGRYLERMGPPLYMNLPPVSGALFWVRGLIDRIEEPMTKLKQTCAAPVKRTPLRRSQPVADAGRRARCPVIL